jgi:hypothetical protein
MLKNPVEYERDGYFVGKIHGHFSPCFSCFTIRFLLLTARELWWLNQELIELR